MNCGSDPIINICDHDQNALVSEGDTIEIVSPVSGQTVSVTVSAATALTPAAKQAFQDLGLSCETRNLIGAPIANVLRFAHNVSAYYTAHGASTRSDSVLSSLRQEAQGQSWVHPARLDELEVSAILDSLIAKKVSDTKKNIQAAQARGFTFSPSQYEIVRAQLAKQLDRIPIYTPGSSIGAFVKTALRESSHLLSLEAIYTSLIPSGATLDNNLLVRRKAAFDSLYALFTNPNHQTELAKEPVVSLGGLCFSAERITLAPVAPALEALEKNEKRYAALLKRSARCKTNPADPSPDLDRFRAKTDAAKAYAQALRLVALDLDAPEDERKLALARARIAGEDAGIRDFAFLEPFVPFLGITPSPNADPLDELLKPLKLLEVKKTFPEEPVGILYNQPDPNKSVYDWVLPDFLVIYFNGLGISEATITLNADDTILASANGQKNHAIPPVLFNRYLDSMKQELKNMSITQPCTVRYLYHTVTLRPM